MPEGPAIVLLKEKLRPLIGQRLVHIEKGSADVQQDLLLDQVVTEVVSHGKQLFICFKNLSLRIHMLLFGSYTINSTKKGSLTAGLYFANDYLHFYSSHLKLIKEPLSEVLDFRRDVLGARWDGKLAVNSMKKYKESLICDVLLNQDLFAGVGNKAKNEVLFRTFVHPESIIEWIPDAVLEKIIEECVVFSFQHLEALRSEDMDTFLEVHEQKSCPRHAIPLTIKITGKLKRKSYFCNVCQKLYNR